VASDDPDFIESVEKALRVLQVFSAEEPLLRVSRAAALTGLTRATTRRILLTLERLRFVEFDGTAFRLTPRVLRIGYGYLSSLPLWDHAQGRLRALAEDLNESCSVATLDDKEIVYVARVPANRSMSLTLTIGTRLPAYPTSMGRVLLASLSETALDDYLATTLLERLTPNTVTDVQEFRAVLAGVRQRGFAVVDQEREQGVRSAGTAIRGAQDQVIAAINVSVNAARVSLEELNERMVPKLLEAASDISSYIRPMTQGSPR
jgi:IclR family transcriptional regulator, pca regulon regulatory protein